MWPLKETKIQRNTAFREKVIISGHEMPERVIAASPKTTQENIKHIRENIDKYRAEVKEKYVLRDMPDCELKFFKEPEYIKSADTDIIAEFIYTYEEVNKSAAGYAMVGKIFLGLGLMSAVGLAGLLLVFMGIEGKYKERRKNIPPCTVQYLEDKPHSIVIDSSEYRLDQNGVMPREVRMYLNPWHAEILSKGGCVKTDLVKGE